MARAMQLRALAAALSLGVGLLYLVLLFLVADAEADAGENTFGAYLLLSVPYLIGSVLLMTLDRRPVFVIGAAIQVLVIALFVLFGIGVLGPGVFEYRALSGLHVGWWAVVITGAQVLLFTLLCYLARGPSPSSSPPRST